MSARRIKPPPRGATQPDSELVGLALTIENTDQCIALAEAALRSPKRDADVRRLVQRRHTLLARMARRRARTLDGMRAKARAMQRLLEDRDDPVELMAASLAADLLRGKIVR